MYFFLFVCAFINVSLLPALPTFSRFTALHLSSDFFFHFTCMVSLFSVFEQYLVLVSDEQPQENI